MRWGVRDEAEVEHSTTEIVLKEIEVCQQISRGPTFVVKFLCFLALKCIICSN